MRVIKIGGNVVDSVERRASVLDAIATNGLPTVLVHGGGKLATELAERLNVPQTLVDGRRITDAETLRIVTMVYGGLVNKTLVAELQARGVNAIGLTGADGNLMLAHRRVHAERDYGFVGDVDAVNVALLTMLAEAGYTVVCAPLTHDGKGTLLNTNADTIAREIAVALSATTETELSYIFEHEGVLRDVNDASSAFVQLSRAQAQAYAANGVITAGMLPKLENAFAAAERGVRRVRITRWDALDGGTLIV
ncbi:MAG: acetylglutamate kinase [Candidatus Kapabacteria bacterium]|nr:acetylglutamate kinase [Candidatus Kapabacteria bacterium]